MFLSFYELCADTIESYEGSPKEIPLFISLLPPLRLYAFVRSFSVGIVQAQTRAFALSATELESRRNPDELFVTRRKIFGGALKPGIFPLVNLNKISALVMHIDHI